MTKTVLIYRIRKSKQKKLNKSNKQKIIPIIKTKTNFFFKIPILQNSFAHIPFHTVSKRVFQDIFCDSTRWNEINELNFSGGKIQ